MNKHSLKKRSDSTRDARYVERTQHTSADYIATIDNQRMESTVQRSVQDLADANLQTNDSRDYRLLSNTQQDVKPAIQRKENNTGLPDQLKQGMEKLSGHSLDHVRVHYNSPKPATVQAHAYAQGNEIHLGSGQERHLPHELGHVVQQMEGRVKPTMEVDGFRVNDHPKLESEASVLGDRALQVSPGIGVRGGGNARPDPLSHTTKIALQRISPEDRLDQARNRKNIAKYVNLFFTNIGGTALQCVLAFFGEVGPTLAGALGGAGILMVGKVYEGFSIEKDIAQYDLVRNKPNLPEDQKEQCTKIINTLNTLKIIISRQTLWSCLFTFFQVISISAPPVSIAMAVTNAIGNGIAACVIFHYNRKLEQWKKDLRLD